MIYHSRDDHLSLQFNFASSTRASMFLLLLSVMTFFGVYALPMQNPPAPSRDPSRILSQAVGPFIQKNCQTCHNTSLPSGSLDLEQLLAAPNSLAEQPDTWQNIAYRIRSGGMPPEGAPKPSKADADAAL